MSKMFLLYETHLNRQGRIDLKNWYDGMSADNVDAIVMAELSLEANRHIYRATLHINHDDGSAHMRNYKRSGPTWMLTDKMNLMSDRDVVKIWASIFITVAVICFLFWLTGVR